MMNENNRRDLVVGLFVLFIIFVMVFIGYSLSGGLKKEPTQTYTANFKSITGLNEGSSIFYKGFKIGKVGKIFINPKKPQYVSVDMEINKDIIIYKQTVASIESIGITGQAQIELSLDLDDNQIHKLIPIKIIKGDIPEIKTMPSQLDSILKNVNKISNSLAQITNKVNNFLSSNSYKRFQLLTQSAITLMYNISNSSLYFNKTLVNLNNSMIDVRQLIQKTNNVLSLIEYDPSVIINGVEHDDN